MNDQKKAELNDFHSPTDFIRSLPYSIRKRLFDFTEERQETSHNLSDMLQEEARALQLYDAIYADVDAEHDLSNPILSRTVRGCVDHAGRVPEGADRDILLRECPQVLAAIESAYDKHIRLIQPTKSPTP